MILEGGISKVEHYLYWEDDAKDAYLFGTSLIIEGKRISFSNEMIPSGNAIKIWNSITNFQGSRTQPDLPLLQKNTRYTLDILGTVVPENTLYLRVVFYNRFHDEISFVVLKDGDREFTYPQDAFSYQIELVNAGMKKLSFEALVLASEDNQTELVLDDALYPSGGDTLHLLFSENPFHIYTDKDKQVLEKLGDVYVVSDKAAYDNLYCDEQFIKDLRHKISQHVSGYQKVDFIGYGPIGNFAAIYYSNWFGSGRAYVTNVFYPEKRYQQLLKGLGNAVSKTLEVRKSGNVVYYAKSADREHEAFQLVPDLISRLDVLNELSILRKY